MEASGPVFRVLRSAPVQAIARPAGRFVGDPVLGDDPDSQRLRHTRRHQPVDSFVDALVDPQPLAGAHAYLGIAFSHFGHIMAEMVHRIMPTRQIVFSPRWLILAARGSDPVFAALPSLCRQILALFGIDETNCTVLAQDAIVEELLIVEAGADLGGGAKPWYLDLMRGFAPALIPPRPGYPDQVYVSRAGLGATSGFLGEAMLEAMLARAGFHILHPERLPLIEQMARYANARVLIFAEGSACHGVELFGRDGLRHTILLNRRERARNSFARVLALRSRRSDAFTGNHYLGSARLSGNLRPSTNRGVTLLALPRLAAFLTAAGVGTFDLPPPADYRAAARADLERYLATLVPGPRSPADLADRLRAAFDAAIQEPADAIAPAAAGEADRHERRLRRAHRIAAAQAD